MDVLVRSSWPILYEIRASYTILNVSRWSTAYFADGAGFVCVEGNSNAVCDDEDGGAAAFAHAAHLDYGHPIGATHTQSVGCVFAWTTVGECRAVVLCVSSCMCQG